MQSRSRPATMMDIARHTGVSKVTVSAVLTGSVGNHTRVAETTRQRILESARELNYAPNGIARMFRQRSTNIIGLYLGGWKLNTHDLFFAEIVSGLQDGCGIHQKDLLIHGAAGGYSLNDVHSELINRKIDGLVILTQENNALAERLASSHMPVVAIADAVPGLPSILADDRAGSEMIADYLAAQGHRRVLYRPGLPFQTSANRRREAFHQAAARLGITILEDNERTKNFEFALSDYEKEIVIPRRADAPTAIVCCNDLLAYATFDDCHDAGLRVPEDVAITGFDGIVTQVRPMARLTTIRAPWSDIARTALDTIVKILQGGSVPDETVLPVELIVGKTT